VIRSDGWAAYSIWEHSAHVRELYARRCRLEEPEMTCHAQAAEILALRVAPGDSVLDAGCGSGVFYHSLRTRKIDAQYHGIDASPSLIAVGRRLLPEHGLPADRLRVLRIEDLDGEVDHAVCINVLSNLDNYHRPLERLLRCARKTVVLRESFRDQAEYAYVVDKYLDPGVNLRVHVNAYPMQEVADLAASCGFSARWVEDRHTGGQPESVIDHLHYWKFLVAERTGPGQGER
jgi:ubiquinone/menaquinone biosynthesis C-methylase UbiE